jgi:two-component system sensor histidine kinase CpxA
MKVKFPLLLQAALFLALHLLVLALVFLLLFNTQFGVGWEALISSPLGDRVEGISLNIRQNLRSRPRSEWTQVLTEFSKLYGVKFFVFDRRGRQIAGEAITLPPEVQSRLERRRPPGRFPDGEPVPVAFPPIQPPPEHMRDRAMRPRFLVHTDSPRMFWVGVRFGIPASPNEPGAISVSEGWIFPGCLLAACPNLWNCRLFFDFTVLLAVVAGVFAISVLMWWPFVYSITKAMSDVTALTEQIAEGRFGRRLKVARADEIGRLSEAVNIMAQRLEDFVVGQKRFLGDTAHELCSPVSRLRIALELLESSATAEQETVVNDIREDIEEMSNLINELLAFSKAGLQGKEICMLPINIADTLRGVVAKTAADADVVMELPNDLLVLGDQLLLDRAFGNIIRNAVRYAGQDGPISIKAKRVGQEVIVSVIDSGPGVNAEALKLLGQPFFRPEPSRSRSSGGVGLGLAIVKTCVESCNGDFKVRNHQPRGLQVEVRLQLAPAQQASATSTPAVKESTNTAKS